MLLVQVYNTIMVKKTIIKEQSSMLCRGNCCFIYRNLLRASDKTFHSTQECGIFLGERRSLASPQTLMTEQCKETQVKLCKS